MKQVRKMLVFGLAVMLGVLVMSGAWKGGISEAETTDDGFEWRKNISEASGNSITIIGYRGNAGDLVIPDMINYTKVKYINDAFKNCISLTSVVIPEGVTEIRNNAFSDCSNLTSVVIPEGVTEIGYDAFKNCSSLTSIKIPSSVTVIERGAFSGCDSLAEIVVADDNPTYRSENNAIVEKEGNVLIAGCKTTTISDDINEIGMTAFSGCSGLTSITIPESVTSIGYGAFENCGNLIEINVADGNPTYKSENNAIIETSSNTLIRGCKGTIIPDDVSVIYDFAFSGCSGMTSITIPSNVTEIGYGVFSGCDDLAEINVATGNPTYKSENNAIVEKEYNALVTGCKTTTISNDVTYIYSRAFYGCTGLTSITIPEGVTEIGYEVFSGCSGLTSVTIPQSVTSIGELAFCDCSGLTSITIPEGVTEIGDEAFSGCSSIGSITIPEGVTEIGWGVFSDCSNLTSVTIPESVTEIGSEAFKGCSNLTSVTIPESVTEIGRAAFKGCSSLTSIIIPDKVESVGTIAFSHCEALKSITLSAGLKSLGSYWDSYDFYFITAFDGISSDATFNVVKDSYADRIITEEHASCNIVRRDPIFVADITIKNDKGTTVTSLALVDGQAAALNAVAAPENASFKSVTWSSSDEDIATVSSTGVVTAVAAGTATITVKAKDGSDVTAACTVNVTAHAHDTTGAEWESDNEEHWKICKICNGKAEKAVHAVADWEETQAPTADEFGTEEGVCSVCQKTVTRKVPRIPSVSIEYYYEENADGTLTITGCEEADYGGDDDEIPERELIIPGKIQTENGEKTVTAIDQYAFANDDTIVSVTVPASVTKIDSFAFKDCFNLNEVVIIGRITELGNSVFEGTSWLEDKLWWGNDSIVMGNILVRVYENFEGVYSLPEGVEKIAGGAFRYCDELTGIKGISKITNIAPDTFAGCKRLKNITIPDGVTSIGAYAFSGCRSLTEITIPGAVESLGIGAFQECMNLQKVVIEEGLTVIEGEVFCDCPKLDSITIPASVEHISSNEFNSIAEDPVFYVVKDSYADTFFTEIYDKPCQVIREDVIFIETIVLKDSKGDAIADEINMTEKQEVTLIPVIAPETANNKKLKWTSSDEDVATVSSTGVVTAVAAGSATITVTAKDGSGVTATCTVKVTKHTCEADNPAVYESDATDHWKVCKVCGKKVGDKEKHTVTAWEQTVAPTTTTEGEEKRNCTVCDWEEVRSVDRLPGNPSEGGNSGNVNDSGSGDDPGTGDKPGSGDNPGTGEDTKVEAPKKNAKVEDTKSKTSFVVTASGKVDGNKVTGAEVAFTGADKKVKSVTVPDTVTVDGITYKVTSIKDNALKNNKKVTKVTVGKNITKIGKNAFSGCKNLKTITVKSTKLKTVGKNALKGINSKATIKVPKKQKNAYKKLFAKNSGFKKTMKIK